MKRIAMLVVLPLVLLGCGVPETVTKEASVQEALAIRMVQLIDEGKTTRDQEQAFIRATAKAWTTFREAVK